MPRRPWFQFHLSTCVVMMVVVGLLLWLNIRPSYEEGTFESMTYYPTIEKRGFPFTYLRKEYTTKIISDEDGLVELEWLGNNLALDVLCFCLSLLAVGVFIESPIRRSRQTEPRQ